MTISQAEVDAVSTPATMDTRFGELRFPDGVQPDGVDDGNWIQTVPGRGWFPILRCYSPKASFFDKSWRPGAIEPE